MNTTRFAQWATQRGHPVLVAACLAGLSALTVAAHWQFGDVGLYLMAALLPVAGLGLLYVPPSGRLRQDAPASGSGRDGDTTLDEAVAAALAARRGGRRGTACILMTIDDFTQLRDRLGLRAAEDIARRTHDRLRTILRGTDTITELGDGVFGTVLAPVPRLDLETLLQITARLQRATTEPMVLNGTHVHLTLSIGLSQPERVPDVTADGLIAAAEAALREAHAHGPGSVRVYSPEIHRKRVAESQLVQEVSEALELGQIRPWFQPQISTDTGRVTGMEALARWNHPDRGLVPPGDFLPAIETAGLLDRLGEVILHHSFTALRAWDQTGHHVPSVGVNFTLTELRNPTLIDRVAWELDRFGLAPERLTIEVLENVIAEGGEDIVARNITGMSQLGCGIDLDDFGTGHSSITNIRRFTINRLKIDRSFVLRVNEDREQQRLLSAILTMAERLDLDTLAEGVESVGEHTLVAQLGCGHVQGFAIARPMPFEDSLPWLATHDAKLSDPPLIGRASG